MEIWLSDRVRLAAVVVFCTLLWSVECIVPLFLYPRGRLRRALPNLGLASGLVLMNLSLASTTVALSAYVTSNGIGLLGRSHLHRGILLVIGVSGLDLATYVAHLLMHQVPLGWKFHSIHHSETEVDVTTTFRQHPGETLWRLLWQWLAIVLFGLPLWVTAIYLSLSALNALLEHSNVRINEPLDRWLRLLVVTPNMHKVHHSREKGETNSNYSNILSIWDRLFCTYTPVTKWEALRYGLEHQRDESLGEMLGGPFRTR